MKKKDIFEINKTGHRVLGYVATPGYVLLNERFKINSEWEKKFLASEEKGKE